MMQQTTNFKRILSILPVAALSPKEVQRVVNQRLTPRLWGSQLVLKTSLEGKVAETARKWTQIDPSEPRMQKILQDTFADCDLRELPEIQKHTLYRCKYSYAPPTAPPESSLRQLQGVLVAREPERGEGAVHWSEDREELGRLSLLKDRLPSMAPIDAELLNRVFGVHSSNETVEDLEALLLYVQQTDVFLERAPDALKVPFTEAIRLEKALQGATLATQWELAEKTAEEISHLAFQERKIVFGKTTGRPFALSEEVLNQLPPQVKEIFLHNDPSELAKYLTARVLENGPLASGGMMEGLRGVINEGLLQYLCPALCQSLLTDRSIMAKICLAPLEPFRWQIHKDINNFLSSNEKTTFPWALQLANIDDAQLETISQASREGNGQLEVALKEILEKKLKSICTQVHDNSFGQLTKLGATFPPYVATLIRMMGYGDLGEEPQTFWLEVVKEETGMFCLSVFSAGSAAYLRPSQQRDEEIAHQVLLQYRDLPESRLDADFFNTLFSYQRPGVFSSIQTFQDGLLKSLNQAPASLTREKEAFSSRIAKQSGAWGALEAYLQYRLKFDEASRFELHKTALFDAWAAYAENPSLRAPLATHAEALLEEALARFDRKEIDLEGLKRLYASVWEILEVVREPKRIQEQKQVMIPTSLYPHFQALMQATPPGMVAMVKGLLIGATNGEVEEMLDAMGESKMPQPLAPTLKEIANAALMISCGLTLSTFTDPSVWSVFPIAFLTARVALIIIFPPVGIHLSIAWTVGLIAQYVLRRVAIYFFPETLLAISRMQNRWIGQMLTSFFMSGEQKQHFSAFVDGWRARLLRSGKISYELSSGPQGKGQKFTPRLPEIEVTRVDRAAAALLPLAARREAIEDPAALSAVLEKWFQESNGYREDAIDLRYLLNEHFKDLPVPVSGVNEQFWTQVADPAKIIRWLTILAFMLSKSERGNYTHAQLHQEITLNLYKVYAIIDRLARCLPETKLEGFTLNGWSLATWHRRSSFRHMTHEMHRQLSALQAYFGVSPEKEVRLEGFHSAEYLEEESRCLFFPADDLSMSTLPLAVKSSMERYLKQFLGDRRIESEIVRTLRKLEINGGGISYHDRIVTLFADETKERNPPWGNPGVVAHRDTPREGILPEPFQMLRFMHRIAHVAMNEKFVSSLGPFSDFVSLIKRMDFLGNILQGGITVLQVPIPRTTQSASNVLPRNVSLVLQRNAVDFGMRGGGEIRGWASLANSQWDDLEDHWKALGGSGKDHGRRTNLTTIISDFLHLPPRKQGEIVEKVGSLKYPRFYQDPTQIVRNLFQQLPNALSDLPEQDRGLIEMIRSDRGDQAVRTLAYFDQCIDRFVQQEFLFIFRVLLLQGDILYPYLQKHPEFSETLKHFFTKALNAYSNIAHKDVYLALYEIAVLAQMAAPQATGYFPDLRDSLSKMEALVGRADARIHVLRALPWSLIEPDQIAPELLHTALSDIATSRCFENDGTVPIYFRSTSRALFWKWEPILQRVLTEDIDYRSALLNRIAIQKEWIEPTAPPLQWSGTYPAYLAGVFQIDLSNLQKISGDLKDSVKQCLGQIFSSPLPAFTSPRGGVYHVVGHGIEISVGIKEGETFHHLVVRKKYKGEMYQWVRGEGEEEDLTYWMNREAGKLIALDKEGFVRSERFARAEQDGIYHIDSTPMGEELNLKTAGHHLQLLEWFQPLSDIRAFARDGKIVQIEFTKLGLHFHIEGDRAFGEGTVLSGLMIAENQRQEDRFPDLMQYARYLLVEDSKGKVKVLLPSDTLLSAAFSGIFHRFTEIQTPQILDRFLDTLWQIPQKTTHFLYEIDAQGHLTSSDPQAVLHLLCHSLAQGSLPDIRRNLSHLENLAKRTPFSDDCLIIKTSIQLSSLLMNNPEITRVALRLGAMMEESRLLRAPDMKEPSAQGKMEAFISWVILQANYFQYANLSSKRTLFPVTEFQELFVLNAIAKYARSLASFGEESDSGAVKELVKLFGIDQVAVSVLMLPSISNRYAVLRKRYDFGTIQESLSLHTVVNTMLFGDDPEAATKAFQSGLGASLLTNLTQSIEELRSADYNVNMKYVTDECNAAWEEVPLVAGKISVDDWKRFMPLYYRLACGDDAQERERRERLHRTLILLTGTKTSDPDIDLWLEVLRLAYTPSALFPFPKVGQGIAKSVLDRDEIGKACKAVIEAKAWSKSSFAVLEAGASEIANSTVQGLVEYGATQLFRAPPGVPTLLGISYRLTKAYLKAQQQSSEADGKRALLDAPHSLLEDPPSVPFMQQMLQEDDLFAGFAKQVLEEHFELFLSEDVVEDAIPPFDAKSNDELVKEYFGKLNTSVEDYQTTPKQKLDRYEPKGLESFHHFGAHLAEAIKSHTSLLKSFQTDLVSRASLAAKQGGSEQEAIHQFLQGSKTQFAELEEGVYLQELMRAFCVEEMPFAEDVYRYLIYGTRLHQLQRAYRIWEMAMQQPFESDAAKILFKQLGTEMTRARGYKLDSDQMPEQLMRAYLLFEYATGIMLWEKQVQQTQEMLLEDWRRIILELGTGSGKTFFSIPMVAFIKAIKRGVFNCFPSAIASDCIEQVSSTSEAVFGQAGNAVSITRAKKLNSDSLAALFYALMRAFYEGEHFNGRKTDLQALELKFIEEVDKYRQGDKSVHEKTLAWYMKVLKHIRERVMSNDDEAHLLFRDNEELNHPLGVKKQVKKSYRDVIRKCAHLLGSPEVEKHVGLKEPFPHIIDPITYHTQIQPLLARGLSQWFKISPRDEPMFVNYLCDMEAEIPGFVFRHPKKQQIGLARGILNYVMKDAVSREIFVDYGASKAGNGEYARPYSGSDAPIETSTIRNPYEAILKTCMLFLHTGLQKPQVKNLISKLIKDAHKESGERPFLDTKIARAFHEWMGGKSTLAEWTNGVSEERWDQLTALLHRCDQAILVYAEYFVLPDITYFSENLNSDSQNFASMVQGFLAYTATPGSEGTLPQGTKVQLDRGTMGNFVHFVCTTCNTPESISVIDGATPLACLQKILQERFQPGSPASALIDAGAMFKGLSNRGIAQEVLQFIKDHRPDLKGVVFYGEAQERLFWGTGETDSPVLFRADAISPSEQITIYDDIHTTGADKEQPNDAEGVVTLGKDTDLKKLAQACGRMRKLRTAKQKLSFAVTPAIKRLIAQDGPLTIHKIIEFAQKNEASQGQRNYFTARKKIRNITRRAALDKMINASSVSTMALIFGQFRNVLITKMEEDPFKLFGYPEKKQTPQEALESYKEEQMAIITSSAHFARDERREIRRDLALIGQEKNGYPNTVATSRHVADLGIAQEVAQDVEQEVEQEEELTQQEEMQAELQSESSMGSVPSIRTTSAKWHEGDYFSNLGWLVRFQQPSPEHRNVVIYSVAGSLKSHRGEWTAKLFYPRMWWTNNFLSIVSDGSAVLPPLSPKQKPVLELLVVQQINPEGDTTIVSGAIDQHEAGQWRSRLEEDQGIHPNVKIALFDITLQTVVASCSQKLTDQELFEHPEFCLDVVRWKFLAGQPNFLTHLDEAKDQRMKAAAAQWIGVKNQEQMKTLFLEIHHKRGLSHYEGSDMQALLEPHFEIDI